MRNEWQFFYEIASRGGGKTLRSAHEVHAFAKENKNCHIAIVGDEIEEIRDIRVQGPSGLLKTADTENPIRYYQSKRQLVWPKTGTDARMLTFDSVDRIKGLRFDAIWYKTET